MDTPRHFVRIDGAVDVELMQSRTVAVIGVGAVGSRVAEELARSGVGTLILIDAKEIEEEHLSRHLLGTQELGRNKAVATADHLRMRIPDTTTIGVDGSILEMTRAAVGTLFSGTDVVVAATDDRRAQRRINQRALALDIPAIFPGVADGATSGEVFVALGRGQTPCFGCWDRFREEEASVRAATALGVDLLPTIHVTVRATLGLLDPRSTYAQLFLPDEADHRLRTLFFVANAGTSGDLFAGGRIFRRAIAPFRGHCPDCGRLQRASHWIQARLQRENRTWATAAAPRERRPQI